MHACSIREHGLRISTLLLPSILHLHIRYGVWLHNNCNLFRSTTLNRRTMALPPPFQIMTPLSLAPETYSEYLPLFPPSYPTLRFIFAQRRHKHGRGLGDPVRPRHLLREDALLGTGRRGASLEARAKVRSVVHLELWPGHGAIPRRRLGREAAVGVADVALVFGTVVLGRRGSLAKQRLEQRFETGDAGCYDGCANLNGCPKGVGVVRDVDGRRNSTEGGGVAHQMVRSELSKRKSPCFP